MDNYQDYRRMASEVADRGRYGDSMLMHVNPREVAALDQIAPGTITTNPDTGYPEAFLFGLGTAASLMILGAVGGGTAGAVTAKKRDQPWYEGLAMGAVGGGLAGYGLGAAFPAAGGAAAGLTQAGAAELVASAGSGGVPLAPEVIALAAEPAGTSVPAAAGGLGSTEAMMALGAGSIAADALQPGMKDPWEGSGGDFKGPYASWSYGYQGEEDDPGQLADADWGEGYEDEDEEYSSLA